ncbi:DNA cytosine methyltransferase [Sinorhizobium alkalisoli]|uniref:DNA cytosine methyltransferase n=1 Tax=Sinorhizobium alkalisoli TaxID=1752398 RepID=UPI001AEE36EA|nr:DNA cytosine methyltransferase [Sinorhizobium alkalisoli]
MHRDLSEWIDRWTNVREAARLRSVHDRFVFHGSEWQQFNQVANAVSRPRGFAVARAAEGLLARATIASG